MTETKNVKICTGKEVTVPIDVTVEETVFITQTTILHGNACVLQRARVRDGCEIRDSATVTGDAEVSRNVVMTNSAQVAGNASVVGPVRNGKVLIEGHASLYERARIAADGPLVIRNIEMRGNANIEGRGIVSNATMRYGSYQGWLDITENHHFAYIGKVGSGYDMTLHRVNDGWRINAGCASFNGETIDEVCGVVRENVRENDVPQWGNLPDERFRQYRRQVRRALKYLAAMCHD